MSLVRGGSWAGTNRPGYPFSQRVLVLPRDVDPKSFETYIREQPGGDWVYTHDGPKTAADGNWNFPSED